MELIDRAIPGIEIVTPSGMTVSESMWRFSPAFDKASLKPYMDGTRTVFFPDTTAKKFNVTTGEFEDEGLSMLLGDIIPGMWLRLSGRPIPIKPLGPDEIYVNNMIGPITCIKKSEMTGNPLGEMDKIAAAMGEIKAELKALKVMVAAVLEGMPK
jgi:hypothetical protein